MISKSRSRRAPSLAIQTPQTGAVWKPIQSVTREPAQADSLGRLSQACKWKPATRMCTITHPSPTTLDFKNFNTIANSKGQFSRTVIPQHTVRIAPDGNIRFWRPSLRAFMVRTPNPSRINGFLLYTTQFISNDNVEHIAGIWSVLLNDNVVLPCHFYPMPLPTGNVSQKAPATAPRPVPP